MCIMLLPAEGPLDPETPEFCAHANSAQTGAGPGVAPGPGAGLGSLSSSGADTWCPPPAGWRAWAGRLLGAARTGRDGTRAAPPHLSPTAFPGALPGVGEEEHPQSRSGTAPCRLSRAAAGPEKVAAITVLERLTRFQHPSSHSSDPPPVPGAGGPEGRNQSHVEAPYPL